MSDDVGLGDIIRQWLQSDLIRALRNLSDAILNLNTKADKIMVTLADIQTALAADETAEGKIINLLSTQAQSLTDMAAQLAAAVASNDPVAMQAIVDQMNTDATTMNTAAVNAATPPVTPAPTPAPTDTPAPTPDPNA